MPAFTNAHAATIADSPITALSITTAFMPTSALRPMRAPWITAPWPMWPSISITVSVPGNPCITQLSCTFEPASRISLPKSPRRLAFGAT